MCSSDLSLIDVTRGLATGWLNWGMYDQPEATDVSALTGLLTADGEMKAWGERFRSLADDVTAGSPPRPVGARPAFDWDRFITDIDAAREYRAAYVAAVRAEAGPR